MLVVAGQDRAAASGSRHESSTPQKAKRHCAPAHLLKDWAGEGLITKEQYERLKPETVSELRTTNIFLRLVFFFFTVVVVGAAIGLFFVLLFAGLGANHRRFPLVLRCLSATGLPKSRFRDSVSTATESRKRSPSARLSCSARECCLRYSAADIRRCQADCTLWFRPRVLSFRCGYGTASGSGMHFPPQ